MVLQPLFKMFAKRVSEHLLSKLGDTEEESGEMEARTFLKLYFEKFGKFSCDSDLKKVDGLLSGR